MSSHNGNDEDFGPSKNFTEYHYDKDADYQYNEKIDHSEYVRQLEVLMANRREAANTNHKDLTINNTLATGSKDQTSQTISQHEFSQSETMEMSRQLYKELHERRAKKTCSRCGYYYKYSIETLSRSFIPNDISAEASHTNYFFVTEYKINREVVENPGTLDDDFYDVCSKCRKDMFSGQDSDIKRDRDLWHINREFKRLSELESARQLNQNRLIDQLQKEFRAKRKKANDEKREAAERKLEADNDSKGGET